MPQVAIITPVYNRVHLLPRALRSALAQTFTDWELYVIDNGSTEDVAGTVNDSVAGDPRVHVIASDIPRNANGARAAGVHASSAPWVACLDSDDEWVPDKLEKQLARAAEFEKATGELPGIVYCYYEKRYDSGKRETVDRAFEGFVFEPLLRGFFGISSTLMIRREAMDRCGTFDPVIVTCQEYEMTLRIARQFQFACVHEVLSLVYLHSSQRASDNPDLERVTLELYGNEIQKRFGRPFLAFRRLLSADRYFRAGFIRQGSAECLRALRAWPLSRGAWWRLATLPRHLPGSAGRRAAVTHVSKQAINSFTYRAMHEVPIRHA